MKLLACSFFLLAFASSSYAFQTRFWGELAPGPYQAGYHDTTVFNQDQPYELGTYKGPKPFFISMWFPGGAPTGTPMNYGDYFRIDAHDELRALIDSIKTFQEESFMNYGILHSQDTWDYELMTEEKRQLYEAVLAEPVYPLKSNQFPAAAFPTIIYHHGSGSIASDNSVLFEYLASHGFVVLSAQYHWPGLNAGHYKGAGGMDDVEFVVDFSKTLSFVDSQNLYYAGHSWGGGVGLSLNCRGVRDFKTYIIYDSTIEHQGLEEFAYLYPPMDVLFRTLGQNFETNTTVFTARGSYYEEGKLVVQPFPEFLPYKKYLPQQPLTLLTLLPVLNHNAFTSTGVLRSTLADRLFQSDSTTIAAQFPVYQEVVRMTLQLLQGGDIRNEEIFVQTVED